MRKEGAGSTVVCLVSNVFMYCGDDPAKREELVMETVGERQNSIHNPVCRRDG